MQISIVSPEEKVWQGEADLVVARSPEGELPIPLPAASWCGCAATRNSRLT